MLWNSDSTACWIFHWKRKRWSKKIFMITVDSRPQATKYSYNSLVRGALLISRNRLYIIIWLRLHGALNRITLMAAYCLIGKLLRYVVISRCEFTITRCIIEDVWRGRTHNLTVHVWGPLLLPWINFNQTCIRFYIHCKVWDEFTYTFFNFNGWTLLGMQLLMHARIKLQPC